MSPQEIEKELKAIAKLLHQAKDRLEKLEALDNVEGEYVYYTIGGINNALSNMDQIQYD